MLVKYWIFSPPARWGTDGGTKRGICYFCFHWGKGQNKAKYSLKKWQFLSSLFSLICGRQCLTVISNTIYCTSKCYKIKFTHDSVILKWPYFFVFFFSPVQSKDIILIGRKRSTDLAFYFFIYSISCS